VATTTLAAVFALTTGWALLRPEPPNPVIRYTLGLAADEALREDFGPSHTLSPDGSRLVYVGPGEGGGRALWVKERDELRARRIPGTEGEVLQPFFAPDGQRVGFFQATPTSERALKVVSLEDPGIITLADSGLFRYGGSWGRDGDIYLISDQNRLIRLSSETLSPLEQVTELAPGEVGHVFPEVLPSGRGVLFTVRHREWWLDDADIAVVDLATGEHRILVQGALARYAETGHLVVVRSDGTLMAAPFDEVELEVTGPWVQLLSNVNVSVGSGIDLLGGVDLALSASGTLAYVTGGLSTSITRELVWVERDGSVQVIDPGWRDDFESVALSPDETRLAVTIGVVTVGTDLWIKRLDGGPASLFTFTDGLNRRPTWAPDGMSVTFISDRDGNRDMYVKPADGVGLAVRVLDLAANVDEAFWSPDGEWIIYRSGIVGGERDIFARRAGPDSATVSVAAAPGVDELAPTLSPDGQWLAFVSNETGRNEVWVRPFPDVQTGLRQISTQGGTEPVWAHNGQELFYKSQGSLLAVNVQTSPDFSTGEVRRLFSTGGYFSFGVHRTYDVAGDGQRFVMIRFAGTGVETELVFVENFFELLKERVGSN